VDHSPQQSGSPFADETPRVQALLEQAREQQESGNSAGLILTTGELLGCPLARCADIVHTLRGDAFLEQGDFVAAAEHYRSAIAHGAEDFSLAWFKLGNALAGLGRVDDAAWALNRAAALEPDHPVVWLQLGHALLEGRHYAPAELAFGNALKLTDGAQGNYGLAWLHYAQADGAECTQERLRLTSQGFRELQAAVATGELGPEPGQVGAVQALLEDPDVPFWQCWINPAFALARGDDLLRPPASAAWAELVQWPRDPQGGFRILRDVLLELPDWG
jgi:tetratricopeptide (TPR) repeat protein